MGLTMSTTASVYRRDPRLLATDMINSLVGDSPLVTGEDVDTAEAMIKSALEKGWLPSFSDMVFLTYEGVRGLPHPLAAYRDDVTKLDNYLQSILDRVVG